MSISADGLSLYFAAKDRPGGYGSHDLWVTSRSTVEDNWGIPVNLGATVNSASNDYSLSLSSDGLSLYFSSPRSGGYGNLDIWVTTRATTDGNWGAPINPGPMLNTSYHEFSPSISSDGLLLFFASTRPGGAGGEDLYLARRATTNDEWGSPVNLGAMVNSTFVDAGVTISADGSMLYFHSNRPGGEGTWDMWQAPIQPLVDFNGDGKVDGQDVLCMASRWGTDDPLCDIGPFAWGDGIVGLEDLTVLAEYLGKEVTDSTLIAHWALDETEGSAAHEKISGSDDMIVGSPLWQPTGGQMGGALELDGVDDCVISGVALNPSQGPFSVLAWVKGGGPGQAIISQAAAANWLMADDAGELMTDLKGSGQDGGPLQSQTIITDGQWHRVALTWDGSFRTLCVDGVVAAEDSQDDLAGSSNSLFIGVGKDYAAGTF